MQCADSHRIAISFAFRRQTSPSCAHVCLYTLRSFSLVFLELLASCNPHISHGRSCDSSHILPPFVSATFIMLPHPKLVVNQDFCGILSFTFFLSFSASPIRRFQSRNYILSSYMINVNKQFIPCVYHITYLDFVHSMKFIFIADRQQRCPEGTYLISVNRQFLQIYQITVL